jgi:membrane protease YdiL (CAAX protease family)
VLEGHVRRGGWRIGDFFLVVLMWISGQFIAAIAATALSLPTDQAFIALALGGVLGNVIGVAMVCRLRSGTFADLGFDVHPSDGVFLMVGVAGQFALSIAFDPILRAVGNDATPQGVADQLATLSSMGVRVGAILLVALAVPAAEELVYRGLLMTAVTERWGRTAGLIVPAAVFASVHLLDIERGAIAAGLIVVFELFLFGLFLGGLTRRYGRLGPAVFTHAGFNLIVLLVTFFLS